MREKLVANNYFPECLLRLRRSRGLSQKAVALAAHMDQSYLASLESGRRAPPREKQLLRLASALNANEKETTDLLSARTASKIAALSSQATSSNTSALAQLMMISADLSTDELHTLSQVAEILKSHRLRQSKEVAMSP